MAGITRSGKNNKSDDAQDKPGAVALKYDPVDAYSAPTVVASGIGAVAERIAEEARANDVPIYQDPDLVQLLLATEIGDEIPVEAFVAVAEILRYVYEANRKTVPRYPDEQKEG